MFRPALPNVPAGTRSKAATLNQLSTVSWPSGSPTRFGSQVAPSRLPCVDGERPARCAPCRCRSPSSRRGSRCRCRRCRLARPNGNSATKLATRRCRTSKSLGPSHASMSLVSCGRPELAARCSGAWSVDVADRVGDAVAVAAARSASLGRQIHARYSSTSPTGSRHWMCEKSGYGRAPLPLAGWLRLRSTAMFRPKLPTKSADTTKSATSCRSTPTATCWNVAFSPLGLAARMSSRLSTMFDGSR